MKKIEKPNKTNAYKKETDATFIQIKRKMLKIFTLSYRE